MYPYLLPDLLGYNFPMYDIMTMIGIFVMLGYCARRYEKQEGFTRAQTNRLLVLIVVSLGFALVGSILFDAVFHSIAEGELTFGSITFIGGLIGGVVAFIILQKYFYKDDNKDLKKFLNTLITGVVIAHAFGRIGCFLAGCCYGVPTETFLGVIFPHGHAHTAFPDTKILPTQLFEAAFLFVLFFLLSKIKSFKNIELQVYLIGYGTFRFLIEFLRGDDRGSLFGFVQTEYNLFPTPSQYLSVAMIVLGVVLFVKARKKLTTKVASE